MRYFLLPIAALAFPLSPVNAGPGALETDCHAGGTQQDGSYQFVATCAGKSRSPDGRFVIVQRPYVDRQPPIELRNGHGRLLRTFASLSDDMPFSVSWAPNSRWFYVNHHVGSFMDDIQIFQISGASAIERANLKKAAIRVATNRYPCLPRSMVLPNGVRWLRDGLHIVIVTVSRPSTCQEFGERGGTFHSLWMIGDVRGGRIDPSSIRVQPDDLPFKAPTDGPYSR